MVKKEEKNQENLFRFDSVTRDQFISNISDNKNDKFAKTFVAKCDMLNKWDQVIGLWDNQLLCGAILVTLSKRKPLVANLQLLHTFYKYRNLGVAKKLCNHMLYFCYYVGADYFRVSSEIESIPFYEKIGIKFIGKQKSGCQLSIFKIISSEFSKNNYEIDDYIYKSATKKGKGGCVELFFDYSLGLNKFI